MKPTTIAALAATSVFILAGTASAQTAHPAGHHQVVTPQDIRWSPGPASVPRGAEMAVLYGDPVKEGPFSMRLRLPANYRIPAHSHPVPEIVTILSGTFRLGAGSEADKEKTQALPAGSFFAVQPGSPHFVYIDEVTVVQINSNGPWGINYVNPSEDPRRQ
jgi:hypothetical protein